MRRCDIVAAKRAPDESWRRRVLRYYRKGGRLRWEQCPPIAANRMPTRCWRHAWYFGVKGRDGKPGYEIWQYEIGEGKVVLV